jgi:hypothetical protein
LERFASRRRLLVEKLPENSFRVRWLSAIFPAARFIHIIRDGRDVALSLRQRGWDGVTTYDFAENWRDDVSGAVNAGRALGPEMYLEVSYEDLVLRTEPTLRRICAFLREDFEDVMLHFYEGAENEIPTWESQYHEKTRRPPQVNDVQRWKREMSGLHVAIFESVAGRTMDQVGYPRRFRGLSRLLTAVITLLIKFIDATRSARHRWGIEAPRLRRHL